MEAKAAGDAARRGDLATVKAYLDVGADVNAEIEHVDDAGEPVKRRLLHLAVEGDCEAMVALLLGRGARVDLPVRGRLAGLRSPILSEACLQRASFGVIRLLIEAGADVNAKGPFGRTPVELFHRYRPDPFEAHEKEQEVVELLLDKGADVHVVDIFGRTLLFDCSTPEMAAMLLRRGVDVNARDNAGKTALNYVFFDGVGTHEADIPVSISIARVLLEHGADVNGAGRDGIRPIHEAAYRDCPDYAALLMEYGADTTGSIPAHRVVGGITDLPTRLAKLLVGELAKRPPSERPPLAWPVAVLKWLATAPEAEAEIKKLKTGETLLQTRDELLKLLEDRAWDKRKHLVCCYSETRRLRREGGEKRAKTAAAAVEEGNKEGSEEGAEL